MAPQLTPQEIKNLERLAAIVEKGDLAIFEDLLKTEERLEESTKEGIKIAEQALKVAEETQKKEGPAGYTPVKGKDYFDGEPGKNYVLTPEDKQKIAEGIVVPVVEKIIERTEVIKEQPIVTEVHHTTTEVKEVAVRDTPLEIKRKLLEEGLKIEDIEGLIEKLEKLGKKPAAYVGGASGNGGRVVMAYDLSPLLNGSTKTFTLPAFWRIISVETSSSPYTLRKTIDYTTSGSTITFTSAIDETTTLATGQTVTIIYSE